MKRLIAVVAATIALAIPTAALASTTTQSLTVYRTFPICNGDTIQVTLPVLYVITETETPSGGLLVNIHHSAQGVTAEDLDTGTEYRGGGMTRWFTLSSPPDGSSQTFVNRFHLQALGGAQELTVKVFETAHTQIEPDGTVEVDFDFAIEQLGTC
jgi:hypothetical protein